jgi:hypothetical protein
LRREVQAVARAKRDLPVRLDHRERAIAVELRLPQPIGAIEGTLADLGEHRGELLRHRLHGTRRHQSGGRDAMRRHLLQVLHRSAGKDRAALHGDVVGRDEAVLVLDHEPLALALGLHERERSLHLLAAKLERELSLGEALADFVFGLRAIAEHRAGLVGRIHAAIPDDDLARAVLLRRDDPFERRVRVRVISVCIARRLSCGLRDRPLGTAHDLRTPSHSRRRS